MNRIYFMLVFALGAFSSSAQENSYSFSNTLNENGSAGPALVEALACSAALGSFGSSIINTSAGICGTGPVTVFNFNQGGGLSYPNNAITGTYTVHMFFSFSDVTGYRRIIDFLNGQTDVGLYILNGSLNFYPNGSVGTLNSFAPNTFYLLSLVRDSSTNQIQIYLNGSSFGSYADIAGNYRTAADTTPLYLFRDNIAGGAQCENSGGSIKYFSVEPAVSTPAEVAAIYANICAIALPVKLVSFTVTGEGEANKLQWQTAEEVNVSEYALQRSPDALVWEQISHHPALGYRSYAFTDHHPEPDISYYRLKITDLNGSVSYSQVISRKHEASSFGSISIVPVPAHQSVRIINSHGLSNGEEVSIYDMLGREVHRLVLQPTQAIDINSWPAGIYLLHLPGQGNYKFIKQ